MATCIFVICRAGNSPCCDKIKPAEDEGLGHDAGPLRTELQQATVTPTASTHGAESVHHLAARAFATRDLRLPRANLIVLRSRSRYNYDAFSLYQASNAARARFYFYRTSWNDHTRNALAATLVDASLRTVQTNSRVSGTIIYSYAKWTGSWNHRHLLYCIVNVVGVTCALKGVPGRVRQS